MKPLPTPQQLRYLDALAEHRHFGRAASACAVSQSTLSAGILALELRDRGIRAYNVQPGFIATERMAQDMGGFGFDSSAGAPPDVVGAVVAWLVTDPGAAQLNGSNLEAQDVCRDLHLLAGWPA